LSSKGCYIAKKYDIMKKSQPCYKIRILCT